MGIIIYACGASELDSYDPLECPSSVNNSMPPESGMYYQVSGLKEQTDYYWRVVAVDATNDVEKGGYRNSSTWMFTTDQADSCNNL